MLIRTDSVILQPPHPFAGLRRKHYRGSPSIRRRTSSAAPPCKFRIGTVAATSRNTTRRLSFEQLAALPVRDLAHPDGCHLFSWTSGPHLPRACELIHAWGIQIQHNRFHLGKTQAHIGTTTGVVSHRTRFLCQPGLNDAQGFGISSARAARQLPADSKRSRAYPGTGARAFAQAGRILPPGGCYCDGPFVDLFARKRRPAWDTWGDQVDMFSGGVS